MMNSAAEAQGARELKRCVGALGYLRIFGERRTEYVQVARYRLPNLMAG
jgi:hypothetical protein